MTPLDKELQRMFEFVVKYHPTNGWNNKQIRNFIRWSVFYKRMFVVWAPASNGSRRIAALGVAWRSVDEDTSYSDFDVEKLETGDNLHVFRAIVHPDFRRTGILFQLLSMALFRYPGVKSVYWEGHAREGTRVRSREINQLLESLVKQVKSEVKEKAQDSLERAWEKVQHRQSPTYSLSH